MAPSGSLLQLAPALRAILPDQPPAAIYQSAKVSLGRIPVHSVYVPADRFDADTPSAWSQAAQDAVQRAGGFARLAHLAELPEATTERMAERVESRLKTLPIEDLRIDFEDGYLFRGTPTELVHAKQAGRAAAQLSVPPLQIGIRVSPLTHETCEQSLATLEEFLAALTSEARALPRLVVTIPKVNSAHEVEAANLMLETAEHRFGLSAGSISLELQAETPDFITLLMKSPEFLARMYAEYPRISGVHFGTYDYSASLGIDPGEQRLDHPSADFAKLVLQLATRRGNVRLSDGSTNIIPDPAQGAAAWQHHFRLVQRSLRRGIDQGWDMHPLHLPSRFLAVEAYFQAFAATAQQRLHRFHTHQQSGVMDEPATARALAGFLIDGIRLGALQISEITEQTGLSESQLIAYAQTGWTTERTTT